jgi:cytochrome c551/c552
VSPLGRACTFAAVALAVVTVALWSAGEPSEGSADSAADGADLFLAKGCASCHVGPASGAASSGSPPLDHAQAWAGDRRPGMSAAAYLAESMADPAAFISPVFNGGSGPMTAMPQLVLTSDEVDALVDYLLAG